MSTPLTAKKGAEDELDDTLRPGKWDDYIGQEKTKNNIQIIIEAAKKRGDIPEHLLFYGWSGLGKTTLAHLVAKEIGTEIKITSGPAIERPADLAAILSNLSEGTVLFLDECHRLNRTIEEYLYPAMEDFKLNLILGKGPMARTMEYKLPRFTLIGATTRLASLSNPLRSRFGAVFGLNFYEISDIERILERSSKVLGIEANLPSLNILARCSRQNPRIANHLLRRVRDFAQVRSSGKITEETTKDALRSLEVDEFGLTASDRKILEVLILKFQGGPAGIQALSAAAFEEEETILDVYEPFLMQLGFIERTPKGRVATKSAFKHLGIAFKNSQKPLL